MKVKGPGPEKPPLSPRVSSIDSLRALAMFAVVCIHTTPFISLSPALAGLVNQASRFSVPVFFVLMGYFFERKCGRVGDHWRVYREYAGRLVLIFLAWSFIYMLKPPLSLIREKGLVGGILAGAGEQFSAAAGHPLHFLYQGPTSHLWFLPAAVLSLLVAAAFWPLGMRTLLLLSGGLYLFGLMAGSYSPTPIGFEAGINTRNGPFLGTLFLSLGMAFSRARALPGLGWGILLTVAGLSLHLGEASLLLKVYGVPFMRHDFLAGTALYAVGLVLMALSRPDWGKRTPLPRFGAMTLGVYASHVLLLHLVGRLENHFNPWVWGVASPFLVYLAALTLTLLFSRERHLRRIVV